MKPALIVAFLSLLFIGTHIGLTTRRVRGFLVAKLGTWGFAYLFSGVATLTFSVLMHYYALLRFEGAPGPGLSQFVAFRYAAMAAITLGMSLTIGSFFDFPASALASLDPRTPTPRGLERVTRHPLFVGVALLGVSHALLAAHLVGTVAFGGLALLGIAGAMHQDRKLSGRFGDAYARYVDETSIVPFAAVVRGRQRIVWQELPWFGLALGVALTIVLRSVHSSILAGGGIYVIAVTLGGAATALILTVVRRNRRRAAPALESAVRAAQRH